MAKTAKQDQAAVPEGYARVLVSRWDDEAEVWVFEAKSKGQVVARTEGRFFLTLPVTDEALAEFCKSAKTTFETETGEKVRITGPSAPTARKAFSDVLEPIRGEFREDGKNGVTWTAEMLQERLDNGDAYTGRGGSRTRTISEAEKQDLEQQYNDGKITMREMMYKLGVKISG